MKYLYLLLFVLLLAGCANDEIRGEKCFHGHRYLHLNCDGYEEKVSCWIPLFDDTGHALKCKGEKE